MDDQLNEDGTVSGAKNWLAVSTPSRVVKNVKLYVKMRCGQTVPILYITIYYIEIIAYQNQVIKCRQLKFNVTKAINVLGQGQRT